MLSTRRTLQRNLDQLDGYDLDLHQLPVSNWPVLWQHRMPQKRQSDCVDETSGVKRRRTSQVRIALTFCK